MACGLSRTLSAAGVSLYPTGTPSPRRATEAGRDHARRTPHGHAIAAPKRQKKKNKGRRTQTALAHIILVLRVRLEGDLVVADAALDVEPVFFDAEVIVSNNILLATIKLLPAVHVLAALDAL